jgi:transposase
MLADELDYVIGVDPHRDAHALAVVDVRTGGVVFEATAVADGEGYACVLRLADQHARGRRVFAVEGTGFVRRRSHSLPHPSGRLSP